MNGHRFLGPIPHEPISGSTDIDTDSESLGSEDLDGDSQAFAGNPLFGDDASFEGPDCSASPASSPPARRVPEMTSNRICHLTKHSRSASGGQGMQVDSSDVTARLVERISYLEAQLYGSDLESDDELDDEWDDAEDAYSESSQSSQIVSVASSQSSRWLVESQGGATPSKFALGLQGLARTWQSIIPARVPSMPVTPATPLMLSGESAMSAVSETAVASRHDDQHEDLREAHNAAVLARDAVYQEFHSKKVSLEAANEQLSVLREKTKHLAGVAGETEALRKEAEEMRQAAARYKSRYMEERAQRRALHEQLQALRGNIRVICRIRPGKAGLALATQANADEAGVITVQDAARQREKSFEFNDVCPSTSTQADIFEIVAPMIRSCVDGYNTTIFAYGQTGSGKTYTMSGSEADPGIHARTVKLLISALAEADEEASIEISMMEIYCEQVRDLLGEDPCAKLDVSGLGPGQLCGAQQRVPGLTWDAVSSCNEAMEVLEQGRGNRTTHATDMNAVSSRSHELITLRISSAASTRCLNLTDLAGSERISKSKVEGQQLAEATSINKSLSALGDVIASLQVGTAHVPYRNSKLTQVLQDSLCGNAKVMLVCNVAPEVGESAETLSSLSFAQRAAQVEMGSVSKSQSKGSTIGGAKAAKTAAKAVDVSKHSPNQPASKIKRSPALKTPSTLPRRGVSHV